MDQYLLADAAQNLFPARMQMAVSLGWHIIFSCLGVAFPAIVVFTEWRAHKRGNPDLHDLARTWAKAMGVLFAAGAVSGTLLSFEMGILWPGLMEPFGEVFGFPFVLEGFAFFIEAIFVGIYLFGWDRMSPRAHMLSAVPMIISGAAGAFFVIAANAWMNNPTGFDLDPTGQGDQHRPGGRHVRPVDLAAVRAHVPGGLHGHRVRGRLRVRGGHAARPPRPLPPVRAADPAHRRRDRRRPIQIGVGDWIANMVAENQPVKLAAMEGLFKTGDRGAAVAGRHLLRRRAALRHRDPVGAVAAGHARPER